MRFSLDLMWWSPTRFCTAQNNKFRFISVFNYYYTVTIQGKIKEGLQLKGLSGIVSSLIFLHSLAI